MGNLKVTLNMQGVRAILSSPEVQKDLEQRVNRIAAKATAEAEDNGFTKAQWFPEVHIHRNGVATAHVWPNAGAAIDNNKNRTLIRCLDEGR